MSKFVALHTAEVSEGDDQSENEASYGGYSRVELPEDGAIQFPILTSGEGQYYTHASLAEEDGVITDVIELLPPTKGQTGAGANFNASDFA
jgi:hypothetical protein